MAIIALKIKIMPESPQEDLDKILEEAKKTINKFKASLHSHEIEPIAFGLKALIVTIAWPEEQEIDAFESAIKKISGVQSSEIIDFRRAIG